MASVVSIENAVRDLENDDDDMSDISESSDEASEDEQEAGPTDPSDFTWIRKDTPAFTVHRFSGRPGMMVSTWHDGLPN